jgi:hypothetical protein
MMIKFKGHAHLLKYEKKKKKFLICLFPVISAEILKMAQVTLQKAISITL